MTDQPTTDDLDAWLDAGASPEAHIDVCLAGNLRDEHAALVEEIAAETDKVAAVNAKPEHARTMEDRAVVRRAQEAGSALMEQVDSLAGRMAAQTRTFHLQAIQPAAYRLLQVKHPPRDDDPHDKAFGVNVDTFFPELVKACTLSPALTGEQWASLMTKLSPLQWDQLWGAAHSLNRREVLVPKSRPGSGPTETSDAG